MIGGCPLYHHFSLKQRGGMVDQTLRYLSCLAGQQSLIVLVPNFAHFWPILQQKPVVKSTPLLPYHIKYPHHTGAAAGQRGPSGWNYHHSVIREKYFVLSHKHHFLVTFSSQFLTVTHSLYIWSCYSFWSIIIAGSLFSVRESFSGFLLRKWCIVKTERCRRQSYDVMCGYA